MDQCKSHFEAKERALLLETLKLREILVVLNYYYYYLKKILLYKSKLILVHNHMIFIKACLREWQRMCVGAASHAFCGSLRVNSLTSNGAWLPLCLIPGGQCLGLGQPSYYHSILSCFFGLLYFIFFFKKKIDRRSMNCFHSGMPHRFEYIQETGGPTGRNLRFGLHFLVYFHKLRECEQ